MTQMSRTFALIYLVFVFGNHAAAQSRLLVGRLVNAGSRPPTPVGQAKVTLVDTNQEALTDANGRFQFTLRAALGAGFEVQIAVKAGNLRIYLPRNGVVVIPAPGARPVEVQLLPAGSKLFLEPAAIEALLAQASKPPTTAARNDPGQPADREPRLKRFLEQWAADYGFSLEDVEREVKNWGDQVRAKRQDASVRQRALAEFQAQHFVEAAMLFEESASAEATALDKVERERKERELEERAVLRRFLDDKIRAAEALTQGLKYEQAAQVLEVAAKRVDRGRYAGFWAEMQVRCGLALGDLGSSGEAPLSIASLRAAVAAYQNALQVYTKESLPQDWAATQNNLGNANASLGMRLSGAENLRAAVVAYQNALQVYTKESLPQGWATTQNNLGSAYASLGERLSGTEAVDSLRAAAIAFQNALQVRTKESLPQDWAMTQNNLGDAYLSLGERLSAKDFVESLRAAVTAFQNALQVYTKESLPQAWAATQNNLGAAYDALGERLGGTKGAESLRAAVAAF
ncbi:MAG: hypothetical protein LAQ69_26235, partial [Acidobacteriia bacterium]|nr:hypothetical protein [Terriglobia bacterium]